MKYFFCSTKFFQNFASKNAAANICLALFLYNLANNVFFFIILTSYFVEQ